MKTYQNIVVGSMKLIKLGLNVDKLGYKNDILIKTIILILTMIQRVFPINNHRIHYANNRLHHFTMFSDIKTHSRYLARLRVKSFEFKYKIL